MQRDLINSQSAIFNDIYDDNLDDLDEHFTFSQNNNQQNNKNWNQINSEIKNSLQFSNVEELSSSNNSISKRGFFVLSPNPFRQSNSLNYVSTPDNSSGERDNNLIDHKIDFAEETPIRTLKMPEFSTDEKSIKLIEELQKVGFKNSKGLRSLSESVYEIVRQFRVTTYKEVANQLILQVITYNETTLNQNRQSIKKDQQNVKRRAYDALNVLIAANVLLKDGKKVCINSENDSKVNSNCNNGHNLLKEKFIELQKIFETQKLRIRQKHQQLCHLKEKKSIIRNFVRRNSKSKMPQSQIFRFPLIVIPYFPQKFQGLKRKGSLISLHFQERFDILGDIDMLLRINQQSVGRNSNIW